MIRGIIFPNERILDFLGTTEGMFEFREVGRFMTVG